MLMSWTLEVSGVIFFVLEEFVYNNSYYFSIQIEPFEALHSNHCQPLIGWLILKMLNLW